MAEGKKNYKKRYSKVLAGIIMTNKPDKLFGSINAFAVRLVFENDPDQGQGATEEESVSWGSFEIWINNKNLCLYMYDGKPVGSVHWYLIALIEWFAKNLDPLLHEERLPNENDGDNAWESLANTQHPPDQYDENKEDQWYGLWRQWWLRHCLQSCRCGGMFPDVVIRRFQDMVEISWGKGKLPGIPENVEFIYQGGVERIDPVKIARPLYEALRFAVDYFLKRLPESQRFQAVAKSVESIKHSTRDSRLAWLAGVGSSYETIKIKWDKITTKIRGSNREIADYLLKVDDDDDGLVIIGSCHAALMFGSASPTLDDGDLDILIGKLIDCYDAQNIETSGLKNFISKESIAFGSYPWEAGYNFAEQVINHLGLENKFEDMVDIDKVLRDLEINIVEISLSDKNIRGVSIAGPHHKPSILINKSDSRNNESEGRRFTLAHELCHIFFDRKYGNKLAIVSGEWAPLQVEQRANAFAAMFLMPRELLNKAINSLNNNEYMSEKGIYEIRKRLGTSFRATLNHMENLKLIDKSTSEHISASRDERVSI